jgi:hypothetical protein
MKPPITLDDMISELQRMLTKRVRTGAEVDRRTEVFKAAIAYIQKRKAAGDA